ATNEQAEPAARADWRLPSIAVPLRYELDLAIDPRESRFSGRVEIVVSLARPTRYVVLHARALSFRSIAARVGSQGIEGKAVYHHPPSAHADEVLLHFSSGLAGTATLSIAYDAPFDESGDTRGLFRIKETRGWYAFTQFEPSGAREMFPCFDEPGFKTPFDVT